jgi:hypothetical protein
MLKRLVLSGVALVGLFVAGASVASADHGYYGPYCNGIHAPYSAYRVYSPYVAPYPYPYVGHSAFLPSISYGYGGYGGYNYGHGYPSYYQSFRHPTYRSGIGIGVGGVSVYLGR